MVAIIIKQVKQSKDNNMATSTSFANIFQSLRSFFDDSNSFEKRIKEETPEQLKIVNANVTIEKGQTWRSAMDYSDRYSEPVFLKIDSVDIENNTVFFTNSYTGEKIHEKSIDDLKKHFVLTK